MSSPFGLALRLAERAEFHISLVARNSLSGCARVFDRRSQETCAEHSAKSYKAIYDRSNRNAPFAHSLGTEILSPEMRSLEFFSRNRDNILPSGTNLAAYNLVV